eukprot:176881-Amphidinium_carterae.1
MAANSLRGGKNVYGPHCLQSNWAEVIKTVPKSQKRISNQKGSVGSVGWRGVLQERLEPDNVEQVPELHTIAFVTQLQPCFAHESN